MIPLFSVQQIREADSFAINELGIPGMVLMENASLSIFNTVTASFSDLSKDRPVGFTCGKGNNAGDGFALARHFINNGYKAVIIYIAGEDELKGDALSNFKILQSLVGKSHNGSRLIKYNSLEDLDVLKDCSLVFDALLGTGSKGKLKQPFSSIVHELNQMELRRIAIDIPTGLDADTGAGDSVFKAEMTVTLAELKPTLTASSYPARCSRFSSRD